MTHDATDLRWQIEDVIRLHGSKQAAAYALGVTPQYLGNVLLGKRTLGPKLAKALGYERIRVYRKVEG